MAEEGNFVMLKGGRKTFSTIISVLLLIVIIIYIFYYLYVSSVLENLIELEPSYPNEKPFITLGSATTAKIDAKYLATVTLTTVGYGDATPNTEKVQIMMCIMVVFIGGILTRMLFYTFDMFVDHVLLYYPRRNSVLNFLFFDGGIICSLFKIFTASFLIVPQIWIGAMVIMEYEKDKGHGFDPYYLSIISASTVGYGDKVFKTESGRIFASTWLYVAVYFVDKGLCMLAGILPDGFVRFFTYIFSRKTDEGNDVQPSPTERHRTSS